jgi:hypothetical protein
VLPFASDNHWRQLLKIANEYYSHATEWLVVAKQISETSVNYISNIFVDHRHFVPYQNTQSTQFLSCFRIPRTERIFVRWNWYSQCGMRCFAVQHQRCSESARRYAQNIEAIATQCGGKSIGPQSFASACWT